MQMSASRLLHESLLHVRPSPVAAALKKLLGIERRVVRLEAGVFEVDPVSHLGTQLLYRGEYEPELAAVMRHYLRPGGTFVDVGANEGYFSVLAARLLGPSGRVIAVEPQRRLRPVIERNLELNGLTNVTIHECAVSDADGEARLHLTPDTITGSSGLAQMTRYRVPTTTVHTVTLETLLADAGVEHVDLMKMDIEGFEHEAILGSPDVFRRGRIGTIALELHRSRITARGLDPDEIVRFVESYGYGRDADFWGTYYVWTRRA